MSKGHLNLSVDQNLIQYAKDNMLNLSKLMGETLLAMQGDHSIEELEKIEETLRMKLKQLEDTHTSILIKIGEMRTKKVNEENKLIEDIEKIPEISNLTPTDLGNIKILSNIVDIVREKYNVKTIGIAQIRQYFKLKGIANRDSQSSIELERTEREGENK